GVGRNSDGTLATNSYDDDDDSESEIRAYCELSCTDASCSTTSENIETNNSNGLHYYTSTVPDDPEPFKFSCNWVEGEGYLTTFTTTLPDSPTDLSVNGITQAQINLAWTDNSDNETGFKIERNGSMINTTDADANSYSDSSVSCGTTYNYSVKATNAVGDSSEITISATTEKCSTSGTPATVLPPELNVSIKFKGEGTVNLDSRVCKSDNEECKYSLKVAKHYSLKATPAAGYEFDRWSGSSTCSDGDIFLIKNTVCQAIFKEKVSETANSAGSSSNSDSSSGSTGNGIISDNFRPVNISTRAKLMGGANNAVAGFILQGSGQQTVMLQGLALENLVDPVITVNKFPSGDLVATNDNWQDAENADKIPENLKLPKITDAGLLLDLRAGGYTINFGSNNESGIGLVSVNLVADENSKYTNDLINLSTRASIQGGANDVIAGFIINGNDTQKVLIIARGLDEGVDTTLKLQKYPSGDTVAENDDWQNADNSGDITVSLNDTDAALLLDLPAGAYTAVMSSNGKKGLGIVEVNIVQ
ncbi:MAG: fibronectin type III domain-containing protein, partial [Candidatus Marithrix sp.]|nr:fibronectin type III domain-containing protein [Candidatus Marithrix sp.]